jgi:hypothetical protein
VFVARRGRHELTRTILGAGQLAELAADAAHWGRPIGMSTPIVDVVALNRSAGHGLPGSLHLLGAPGRAWCNAPFPASPNPKWRTNVAVEANLDAFLDKEWENKSLAEVLKAPVSALQGVSEGDADALKQAFNVKTVGDLGKNKYFRAAQLLSQLAEAGAK